VPWFRRDDETLNEQLLCEAGYSPEGTPTQGDDTVFPTPQDAHVVATAEVPELSAESYSFVTVADGSLIVDDSVEEDLSPLADAVEDHLKPPYRAFATRHEEGVWVIAARQIQVARLAADGDELELTSVAGERTFTVDGRNVEATLAPEELAALGAARSDDYAAHATRLDADLWEVEADAL
jgi:hypothetical protein